MAQDENFRRYIGLSSAAASTADSLSGRSKKVKQKKVPQRGLGVAQLERIISEDQEKREASNILANSDLAVQCHGFRPSLNLSPNTLYKPSPSIPTVEIMHQRSVQISKHVNGGGGGGEMGILSPGNGNWPRIWNGEYSFDGGKNRFDHHGFVFRGQVNFQYDSNSPPLRSLQFQQASTFSSPMVNAVSGISPPSVLNSQMEPPSNQTIHGSNYRPSLLIEEDKMVGMKRSYPFSLESPPAPSLTGNFRPTYASSKSRSDELSSCSNGHKSHIEPRKHYIREGPSHSSPLPQVRDDRMLYGDFLTLAPPTATDCSGRELLDPECMQEQEKSNFQMQWLAPRESSQQPFSFFPEKAQVDHSTTHVNNGNGETIDLNLKL